MRYQLMTSQRLKALIVKIWSPFYARECRFANIRKQSNMVVRKKDLTFAMMALTELKEDDWSMEIDAEPVHFGQDGLGDFDWSNNADDTPVSLALMATNSEVSLLFSNVENLKTVA
ncbi:hypothetical protein Tco_1474177 [Tanacetum coccineum]